jgi:hypothetical protein
MSNSSGVPYGAENLNLGGVSINLRDDEADEGDVLTIQSDGTAAFKPPASNNGTLTGNDGTILYLANQEVQKLPIGTAGQVLTVNGLENAPEWGAGGGGGGGTATALATADPNVVIPLTNTVPNVLNPNQFLGINTLDGSALWKPVDVNLQNAYQSGNNINQFEDLPINNTKTISLAGSDKTILNNSLEIDASVAPLNTNVSITNNTYKAPLFTKFQKESVHKNYMNTYGGTSQAELDCITIDGSADYPSGTAKYGLLVYEGINPLTQVYNTEDFLLGNEFYKNGDLITPYSINTASTVPIFENDGDSIEILTPTKINGLVIRLALLADPVMGYDVQFWDGSNYVNTNYAGSFSNWANFEGTIQWNLRNDEIKDWQQQSVGLGDYYVIRLKRNDGDNFNDPPDTLPRLGDAVGIKQLSSNINYWDRDGEIKTKQILLDETIRLGNNNTATAYSLPTELLGLGGQPLAPRSNFIMITNNNGTMSFIQSPYLYSSSAQLLNVAIPNILLGQPPVVISTGVNPNGENGSLTVPNGAFGVGQSFRLEMAGVVTLLANNTITIILEAVASNVISVIGSIQFDSEKATNKPWRLNSNFHITEISGLNAVVSAVFDFGYQPDQNNAPFAVFGSAATGANVNYTLNQTLQVRIVSGASGSTISTYLMSVNKKF